MKKEEALFEPRLSYIFNWKQRMEAVSGITCPFLSQLGDEFTAKEVKTAYEEDVKYFKGLIEDMRDLTEKF